MGGDCREKNYVSVETIINLRGCQILLVEGGTNIASFSRWHRVELTITNTTENVQDTFWNIISTG